MCAVTAAAVATATAAVAGAAVSASGALSGGGGGGGGAPKQMGMKGFAPATGTQSYTARMLHANRNSLPPTLGQFLASGGERGMDFVDPGLTPKEATQLRYVDSRGKAIPTFDPEQGDLTTEQRVYLGRERRRKRNQQPNTGEWAVSPEERLANRTDKAARLRETLAAGGLRPKREQRLMGKLARVEGKLNGRR